MSEEQSWSRRSLEEAQVRKRDYEHGYRSGNAFNNESGRGAEKRASELRSQEAFERHYQSVMTRPVGTGYLPPGRTRTFAPPAHKGEPSTGQRIATWLNDLPSRPSSGAYWLATSVVALVGFALGLSQGLTAGGAAVWGLLLVVGLAIAVKVTLFLLGVAVVLVEVALVLAFGGAVLYAGYLWLRSSGFL